MYSKWGYKKVIHDSNQEIAVKSDKNEIFIILIKQIVVENLKYTKRVEKGKKTRF